MASNAPMRMDPVLAALERTFGFREFRPLQREIIDAHLGGADVFALLPTGGGKSLCFQLPAVMRDGLTLVVSPLVALMKDQVDQLVAAGVAATFLNSTLSAGEARARLRGLHEGRYKLLYAAPERLMLDNWKDNLRAWGVRAVAIDEAHCISEWGHDFRPEYRQLSSLRELLPDIPVMALTATATGRVREDIIGQLGLRNPAVFVASFLRPNLRYQVLAKDGPVAQVTAFLRARGRESGIVYCASRAATERVASSLESRGFSAKPYHAGLTAAERNLHQDLFLRDEVQIICATIAFGMGINKPNVRWVVHHDLPKNLEGYYQETGRAGRDGLPSDCLLLYSPGDVAKQTHFIDEMSDPAERESARRQLRQMLSYAEDAGCRWHHLLEYFGETMEGAGCAECDNCRAPRESYDATLQAQKLLSCVYRVSRATRFPTGLNHIAAILTGADNDKIRRWGHHTLTTYGIGRETPKNEWTAIGRDLVRIGFLAQSGGQYPTVELTPEGLEALRSRRVIHLARPMSAPAGRARQAATGAVACDEALFERLRALRKRLADERGVPAYVIFGDATLRHMAASKPSTVSQMAGIPGMGQKKLAEFAEIFAREIATHTG